MLFHLLCYKIGICPAESGVLRKMWYVYAIRSIKFDFRYIGMNENSNLRLKIHNSGKVKSTKHYRRYHLAFIEEVGNKEEAIRPVEFGI